MNGARAIAQQEAEFSRQAREILRTLGNDYLDYFNAGILNHPAGADAAGIPIDKIVAKSRLVRTYSSHPEALPEEIQNCIKSFTSGPMGSEIKNMAKKAYKQLSGASPGQCSRIEQYAISLDDILGLCRLDVCFLTEHIKLHPVPGAYEMMLACCIVVSSVDVAGLQENTLRAIVGNSFHNHSPAAKKLVFDELSWKILRKRDETPLTEQEQEDLGRHKIAMEAYWKATER